MAALETAPAAITGSDQALMYALSNVARSGATRSGYVSGAIFITIGSEGTGPGWAKGIVIDSLQISDRLNAEPNTLTATVRGTKPTEGLELTVTIGSRHGPRLFAGHVLRTTQVYAAQNPAHPLWHVEATDYTWLLRATRISWRYRGLSASTIAADIIQKWAPGFAADVQPGLPVLDEITFTNATPMDALMQVVGRIGGIVFCDYVRMIHVGSADAQIGSPPTDLVPTHASLADVSYVRDLTQIVTRAIVEGGGANALAAADAGATAIAVEDGVWYAPTGGLVRSGPQRIQYAAVSQIADPAAAPAVALAPDVIGRLVGTFRWRIAFRSPLGETLPGPASDALVCPAVAAPVATIGVAPGGLGPLVGAYGYGVTFVTAFGETVGGGGASRTANAQGAPAAPVPMARDAGPLVGVYSYKISFLSAVGETLGTAGGFTFPPARLVPGVPGVTGPALSGAGTYRWAATWLTDRGLETAAGAVFTLANAAVHNLTFATPPAPPTGVTRWRLYRSVINGTALKFVAEAPIATAIVDNSIADTELAQAPPTLGNLGQKALVQQIPAGPVGTVGRNVYRTKAGGPLFFFVAQIPGNDPAFEYLDDAPDDALQTPPPLVNTNGEAFLLTLPLGPVGTTGRRVYRTRADDPAHYWRLTELTDNTTTTFLDAVPDRALGGSAAPTVSTAGGSAADLSAIPIGGAGIRERIVYRAIDGTEDYHYVGTVPDNTTTTFRDPGVDTPGRTAPLVSTVGAALTGIPAGDVTGGIRFPIAAGDPVNLVVITDDLAAQAALAATVGGDGVREELLVDGRIGRVEAAARAAALLTARGTVLETLAHRSRDVRTRSGSLITVDLPPPTDIHGTFRIQDVTIGTFNARALVPPTVTAHSAVSRTTFDDWLRTLANTAPPPATGENPT